MKTHKKHNDTIQQSHININKFIITLLLAFTLVACSENGHIPDTSIIDELSTDELSDALDYERTHKLYYGGFRKGFEDMYPMIRRYVNKMSEIEKHDMQSSHIANWSMLKLPFPTQPKTKE